MPATSGRVKMPHNNRLSGSGALKMTGIWKNTIGYDPYAAGDEAKDEEDDARKQEQAQNLLKLARISNLSGVESRGACKKCGMVGHLTFQCRNAVGGAATGAEDSDSDEDSDAVVEGSQPPREVTRSRSRSRDREAISRRGSNSERDGEKHKSKKHKSKKKKSKSRGDDKEAKKHKRKKERGRDKDAEEK